MALNAANEKKIENVLKNTKKFKGEMGFALKEWLQIVESNCDDYGLPVNLRHLVINRGLDDKVKSWWRSLPLNQRDTYDHQVQTLSAQFCPAHLYHTKIKQYLDQRHQNQGDRADNFVALMIRLFNELEVPPSNQEKIEKIEDRLNEDIKRALEGRTFANLDRLVAAATAVEQKLERRSEDKSFALLKGIERELDSTAVWSEHSDKDIISEIKLVGDKKRSAEEAFSELKHEIIDAQRPLIELMQQLLSRGISSSNGAQPVQPPVFPFRNEESRTSSQKVFDRIRDRSPRRVRFSVSSCGFCHKPGHIEEKCLISILICTRISEEEWSWGTQSEILCKLLLPIVLLKNWLPIQQPGEKQQLLGIFKIWRGK